MGCDGTCTTQVKYHLNGGQGSNLTGGLGGGGNSRSSSSHSHHPNGSKMEMLAMSSLQQQPPPPPGRPRRSRSRDSVNSYECIMRKKESRLTR